MQSGTYSCVKLITVKSDLTTSKRHTNVLAYTPKCYLTQPTGLLSPPGTELVPKINSKQSFKLGKLD